MQDLQYSQDRESANAHWFRVAAVARVEGLMKRIWLERTCGRPYAHLKLKLAAAEATAAHWAKIAQETAEEERRRWS